MSTTIRALHKLFSGYLDTMLLSLMQADQEAFLMVLSYLNFADLQNVSDASTQICSFLISASERLWLGTNPPLEKSFVLPTVTDATAIVADETVVGLFLGPTIAFFSLETGMMTSQMVVPGLGPYEGIEHMSLCRKLLAVSFRKVTGYSELVIFDRETETRLYETVQFDNISCLKIFDSLSVVGSSSGLLGVTCLPTLDTSILQHPKQTYVEYLDSNSWLTVVSCDSTFIVWIHATKSVAKVIDRHGFPTDAELAAKGMYRTGSPLDYFGTQVSLSYPIVVSPSFSYGYTADIEVWNIESGTFQYKIEKDSSHHSLRYPLLNLEYAAVCVMNTVVKLDETQFDMVRYFEDDDLEDLEESFDYYGTPHHTLITTFHHITVGRNLNAFGLPIPDQCTKIIVRSFKPK